VTEPGAGGVFADAQTDVPLGIPKGAMCVQRLDDSLNSAIHINYRVSLRSSSMREPRDPLLKVLCVIRLCSQTLSMLRFIEGFPRCRRQADPPAPAGGAAKATRGFHKGFTVHAARDPCGAIRLTLPLPGAHTELSRSSLPRPPSASVRSSPGQRFQCSGRPVQARTF
jgi:hypothetical protein